MKSNKFKFKQFEIEQDLCAMKIGTDSVLLGAWVNCYNTFNILDIGTGTGILALMLAQKNNKNIYAIDIDKDACLQAKQNAELSVFNNEINIINSSLNDFEPPNNFNYIISNPPFFNNSLKSPSESRTIARHSITLPYSDIITFANKYLNNSGKLGLILPFNEANIFIELALKSNFYCCRKCLVKPNPKKDFHRQLLEFSKEIQSTHQSTLIIETETRHHYTDEYKQLTSDFYYSFKY